MPPHFLAVLGVEVCSWEAKLRQSSFGSQDRSPVVEQYFLQKDYCCCYRLQLMKENNIMYVLYFVFTKRNVIKVIPTAGWLKTSSTSNSGKSSCHLAKTRVAWWEGYRGRLYKKQRLKKTTFLITLNTLNVRYQIIFALLSD